MFIILKIQFKFLLLLTSYVKLKCSFNSNIVFHRSFMVGLAVLGLWLVLMTSEVCFNIKDHMIPLFPHQFQTSEPSKGISNSTAYPFLLFFILPLLNFYQHNHQSSLLFSCRALVQSNPCLTTWLGYYTLFLQIPP